MNDFNCERASFNLDFNEVVSVCNITFNNVMSNFILYEIIIFDDKDPLGINNRKKI